MATFQVHLDQHAEKENPPTYAMPLMEKTSATTAFGGGGGGKPAPLQMKTTVTASQSFGNHHHPIMIKDKQQQQLMRTNLATINGNANNGLGRKIVGQGASKPTFREVNKKNDGAVGCPSNPAGFISAQAKKASSTATTTATAVATTVLQTFTVFEDNFDQEQQHTQLHQQQQQHYVGTTTNNENIIYDKENVFIEQHQHQVDFQNTSIHSKTGNEADYALDTTPMSISEVLSPMSVDRSMSSLMTDDGDLKIKITEQQQQQQFDVKQMLDDNKKIDLLRAPLNDRQRFFEVVEYQESILEYFRESEKKHRPKPHYMKRQNDINHSMRTILVDWLVEVSEEYNLDTETLYLAISYIDRFLSHMSVVRSKLQLVGTAAMYIASKYEEIYPPDVNEFVFITDDTYTKTQVLRMEQIILKILCFDLCTPTAYALINTYAVFDNDILDVKYLALYISELSLLEADPYLRFMPSMISASAFALARHCLDLPMWSPKLQTATNYNLEELKEVVLALSKTHCAAAALPQQAIQEKYKAEKFKRVSTVAAIDLSASDYDQLSLNYYGTLATEQCRNENAPDAEAAVNSENVRRMISRMFN